MKNLLAESEGFNPTINYEAKIHWISYVIPVFFIIIGSVGVISFLLLGYKYMLGLVGIISLFLIYLFIRGLLRLLKNRSTKIYVTDTHLTFSTGILGKTLFDLSLNKLEGMYQHQSFLGKALNFGTLVVTTGGVTHTYFIEYPMELRNAIMMLKDNSIK
ncbi:MULTISPECIES: PH domain-containing protein [Empedobacter]|uniref:PH domain-containing protein n=1 Tax=Empedobacter TaxID=59734 RepID=UPI001C57B99A|nr:MULTISPECIES: PH domain-containing protein [Empedobacter]MBW1619040.1 PH domain-containing protein [Empedobacter falsenii]MDM1040230.1 PH domain-containing protein [Empedobacter brevis]MDM1134162.1 PH domain-containing protein [Empedobacter sp. R750]